MRILYIASAAIGEPLIESQVLRYLERLSQQGCTFDLVTFERKAMSEERLEEISDSLAKNGIRWMPFWIRSSKRSTGIFRDIQSATEKLLPHVLEGKVDLIHARSFLPGNIAMRLKKQTGVPVLYDMRGFWAREKYAYGRIKFLPGKWIAQAMEDRVFRAADHLVSLSEAGIAFLAEQGSKKPIQCIPCCVDLDHFKPREKNGRVGEDRPLRLISVGSLGRGYRCDAVFTVFQEFLAFAPNAHLDLISHTNPAEVHAMAAQIGVTDSQYTLEAVSHDAVAQRIAQADAGICMVDPSESKIASCPTKLGEYLACGIPAVANIPIGDVEQILTQDNVGIPTSLDPKALREAARQLADLMKDDGVQHRARQTAERVFDVNVGAAKYLDIYRQLC